MVFGILKADSFRMIMNFVFPIVTAIGLLYCFACGIRLVRAENTVRAEHERRRFQATLIVFLTIFLLLLIVFLISKFLPLNSGDGAEVERKTAEIERLRIRGK